MLLKINFLGKYESILQNNLLIVIFKINIYKIKKKFILSNSNNIKTTLKLIKKLLFYKSYILII